MRNAAVKAEFAGIDNGIGLEAGFVFEEIGAEGADDRNILLTGFNVLEHDIAAHGRKRYKASRQIHFGRR